MWTHSDDAEQKHTDQGANLRLTISGSKRRQPGRLTSMAPRELFNDMGDKPSDCAGPIARGGRGGRVKESARAVQHAIIDILYSLRAPRFASNLKVMGLNPDPDDHRHRKLGISLVGLHLDSLHPCSSREYPDGQH